MSKTIQKSTSTTVRALPSISDLKGMCKLNRLPVGGTKEALYSRLGLTPSDFLPTDKSDDKPKQTLAADTVEDAVVKAFMEATRPIVSNAGITDRKKQDTELKRRYMLKNKTFGSMKLATKMTKAEEDAYGVKMLKAFKTPGGVDKYEYTKVTDASVPKPKPVAKSVTKPKPVTKPKSVAIKIVTKPDKKSKKAPGCFRDDIDDDVFNAVQDFVEKNVAMRFQRRLKKSNMLACLEDFGVAMEEGKSKKACAEAYAEQACCETDSEDDDDEDDDDEDDDDDDDDEDGDDDDDDDMDDDDK